jgi:Holliday junction resolvase RusA-like endonuclease
MKLNEVEMAFTTYMPTKRRIDCDNTVPKFILDGFTESGFIVDDDGSHLKSLTLRTGYDKDNPRTEIEVKIL